ncbi:MAG TPA: Holliday junction resolvase RecU [Paludibacter sp.]|nr:Holliday junction resolvase RecU [Paludibacter sp.]
MATKKTTTKKSSHANRGKEFEELITSKCEEYMEQGIANIYKVPTDWTVLRKYDPVKKISIIFNAFPKEKSIVDYLGDYQGRSIALEAKKTDNKTSFPFGNVKDHQWDFMKSWKGLKFYIIQFKELNKIFLVDADKFGKLKEEADRKSATYKWFEENAILLDEDIDFLKYIK